MAGGGRKLWCQQLQKNHAREKDERERPMPNTQKLQVLSTASTYRVIAKTAESNVMICLFPRTHATLLISACANNSNKLKDESLLAAIHHTRFGRSETRLTSKAQNTETVGFKQGFDISRYRKNGRIEFLTCLFPRTNATLLISARADNSNKQNDLKTKAS